MNKAELFKKIRTLSLNPRDYIVVGSGILGALGLREVDDIDLVVSTTQFKQFDSDKTWQKKYFEDGDYFVAKGVFELGPDWDSRNNAPNLDDLKATEIIIDDIPFVSLDRLKQWKQNKGRPKDIEDVKLIEQYLAKQ